MRKELVFFLLILIFLILVNLKDFFKAITGYVSQILSLALGIANSTQGRFIHFSYPEKIFLLYNGSDFVPVETPVFSVIFQNTGNLEITEKIEIHVLNSTLHNVSSFFDESFDLTPLKTRNFSVIWEPTKTGDYWIVANASYNSTLQTKKTEMNASFEVVYGMDVELTAMTDVYSYCPGDEVEIINKLENVGYFNATGNLTSTTFDSEGREKFNYTWANINVSVNETTYYRKKYLVKEEDEEGIYTLVSNFSYDGRFSTSSYNFRVNKGIGSLVVSPSSLETTIQKGDSSELTLTMWLQWACNETYVILSKSSGPPGDWISFSPGEVLLTPTTGNLTTIIIMVPTDVEEGDYLGKIYATATFDGQTVEIPLIVHVTNVTLPETTTLTPIPAGAPAAPRLALPPEKPIYKLTLNLSRNLITTIVGSNVTFTAFVRNDGTVSVTNVRLLINGIPESWFEINPSLVNITPKKTESFDVLIRIPLNAPAGTYSLKIKASNEVESNIEVLTLIIGKNWEQLANLTLKEVEKLRAEAKSILRLEECLDITEIVLMFGEADSSYQKGIEEFKKASYEKAVAWFTHSMSVYERGIKRVDVIFKMEEEYLKSRWFLISPIHGGKYYFELATSYMSSRNYIDVCKPLKMLRKMLFIGTLFWLCFSFLITILLILLSMVFKRRDVERRIEKIRERLRNIKPLRVRRRSS